MPLLAPPDPFRLLAEWAAPKTNNALAAYYSDPVGFAEDCIEWPQDEGLTEYQRDILSSVVEHKRVCARSLRGAGKTTTIALIVLWFALTRDAAEIDWKVVTTSGSWNQLKLFTWPEIHLWAKRLNWRKIDREPFTAHELLLRELNLLFGSASAVSPSDPARIEGAHAKSLLFIYDEAKSVPNDIFDSAEGAFSGVGEAYALAASTPGEPQGRFYEICQRKAGYEDWHAIHVSLERVVAAGRTTMEWAAKRARQWGANSALYFNHVLGEFHAADVDGVIPVDWVEAAVERWKARTLLSGEYEPPLGALTTVGADIARMGEDKTIFALRYDKRINELRETFHEDTMETAGKLGGILIANPEAMAIVDTDGLGAGVTDRTREAGHKVQAFHAGAKTDNRDSSGELGFINVRAAAWWKMRELLDPANNPEVELPPDDVLLGDLTAPHWSVESGSRIKVESKADIKQRLGRSTDKADAVIQAFWEERKKRKRQMYDATDLGQPRRPPRIEQVGRTSRMHAA